MLVKNIEKTEQNKATFVVEVEPEKFEVAVNKAYNKAKGDINIPGFRKGKAPRSVVEGMYGSDAFYQDAIDIIAPDAFDFGLDESGLKMIGKPGIVDFKVTEDKGVEFTFQIDLYPEVTLGEYKGLKAVKSTGEVTEEMIKAEIDAERKRNARFIDVDDRPAQMGDTANIDFDGYLDGERFDGGFAEGVRLELGSGTFVPGFEEQVVGMEIGELKDINITFPENYAPELAGKDVVFKVKLHGLCIEELPELDDEFIQDISEFETVDEFMADLRVDLEKRAVDSAESSFYSAIMSQACDNMTVEVPELLINAKVDELLHNYAANFGVSDPKVTSEEIMQMMGLDQAAVDANVRPAAVAQVKQELLIEAVIEAENITVTDEEFDEYLKKTAESIQTTPESIIEYFGEAFVKNEYKRDKASKVIMDSAVVLTEADKAE